MRTRISYAVYHEVVGVPAKCQAGLPYVPPSLGLSRGIENTHLLGVDVYMYNLYMLFLLHFERSG